MKEKPIWLFAAIALLMVVVVSRLLGGSFGVGPFEIVFPSPTAGAGSNAVVPSADAIRISIASSSAKQQWLHDVATAFNAGSKTDNQLQFGGKPIYVEIIQEEIDGKKADYRSGTMVADTVQGKIKPTVLSPADESWIARLMNDWHSINGKSIMTGDTSSLVRAPVVVAMWESRAKALGCWPDATPNCTWQNIRALATNPDGWGMLGQPSWGKFKLGYGYVGESNSGSLAVAVLCMIGANKTSGLTMDDVDPENGCGRMIGDIEKSKFHSGKASSWLFDQMSTGREYLDAVITQESEMIDFNRTQGSKLPEPVVAVYPQDGTVVGGHPYAILDGAPWVTADQVGAAKIFRDYLLQPQQQEALISLGLRPANPNAKIGSPIDSRYGANPQAKLVALDLPDALVMDRISEVWHKVKKHSIIALVLDKSGSMSGEKINAALAGAKQFINRADEDDRLMWMPFDDRVYPGAQGLKSQMGEKLVGDISSTSAGNGTALYDAVFLASERLEAYRQEFGDAVRYGIVVLSDGRDTSSKRTLSMLQQKLQPSEQDAAGIQIHTVAIGNDADDDVLKKMANNGHGQFWKGQTQKDMISIYQNIAAYY